MRTKIFISHRSKDVEYAAAFVDFLEDLGVPSRFIVCTSVPNHLIPNGSRIYEWLREQFRDYSLHMLFLLSDNYYESPDCLNEMGAAWVTKADSDVVLLPGFSPDRMRGCIGMDMMGIYCDGDKDILKDRIRQLRDKVCEEFGMSTPEERRWERIRDSLLHVLWKETKEMRKISGQIQQNQHPAFEVKILSTNKQVPGTKEPIENMNNPASHKNVLYAITIQNDSAASDLKVFGRSLDTIARKGETYHICVCYPESPDDRWAPFIYILSRANYPAGADGIPRVVSIEYTLEEFRYKQEFKLENDKSYLPGPAQKVVRPDPEIMIRMKNEMRDLFLKSRDEIAGIPSYELSNSPNKKLKYGDAIVISKDCQDPEWNSDGGFGRYEIYDLCDEGILFYDYLSKNIEVEYYLRGTIRKTMARRLLCLRYEDIIAVDPEGNYGYRCPILYTRYGLEENPFRYFYLDGDIFGLIRNSAITEVRDSE